MKLFALPDATVDRLDRAQWLTPPFDLAFADNSDRTLDCNDFTPNELADLLVTLKEDVESRTYNGADWTITNGATLHTADVQSASWNIAADLLATFVADNPGAAVSFLFTIYNWVIDNEMDPDATSLTEWMNVFATLLGRFVAGPYRIVAVQAFSLGMDVWESFSLGSELSEVFSPGMALSEAA
jgi:hypothetical protein